MVAGRAVAGDPPADFAMRLFTAFQRSMSFAPFSMNTVAEADQGVEAAALFAAAGRGELRAVVREILPLEKAALAHRTIDAGEVFGRIVLVTDRTPETPSFLIWGRSLIACPCVTGRWA
jgi:NADPH:quinone reductase-like Zn-dependent oxidoreductase